MLLLAPSGCVEGATGPLLATKQAELYEGLARVQATKERRMPATKGTCSRTLNSHK